MFIRVETNWPCWAIPATAPTRCDGAMVVIGEDNFHSIACSKCGLGTAGRGPLPDPVLDRLIGEGYIRQLSRRPVETHDLYKFMLDMSRKRRTPQEIAGDLLERFEIFWK